MRLFSIITHGENECKMIGAILHPFD